jgi:hypothetical protein
VVSDVASYVLQVQLFPKLCTNNRREEVLVVSSETSSVEVPDFSVMSQAVLLEPLLIWVPALLAVSPVASSEDQPQHTTRFQQYPNSTAPHCNILSHDSNVYSCTLMNYGQFHHRLLLPHCDRFWLTK